jgi:hypothetical protein
MPTMITAMTTPLGRGSRTRGARVSARHQRTRLVATRRTGANTDFIDESTG